MNSLCIPFKGSLHHLQFGSPEPERLARFYSNVFGGELVEADGGWLSWGPDRNILFTKGTPNTLVSAGYQVSNPSVLEGIRARLQQHGAIIEEPATGMWEPGAVGLRDPDGNRISYGIPTIAPPAEGPSARLQHLVLGSTDAKRMVDFYTRIIGLRRSDDVYDELGALRTCFMRTDFEHHSFAVFQTSENRLDHHCYELPDWNAIRDWGDHLASMHISVEWGPGRHGPGNNLFLFFHDPDDNWLELSAELEHVATDRPVGRWPHAQRTLNSWGTAPLRS